MRRNFQRILGGRRRRAHILRSSLAGAAVCASMLTQAVAADVSRNSLTVTAPRPGPAAPAVPSPLLPGAPIPWSGSPLLTPLDLSIVDGRTRFLTAGPAQERCPGDRVVFVPGVVNPFRPSAPGDGAFMCRGDAVMQGFVAR